MVVDMLLKLGVDISHLEMHTRKSLRSVEVIFENSGAAEPVITSTYEGNHSVSSLHYQNRAYDLRLPFKTIKMNREVVKHLRSNLENGFDIILERTHIHIAYDPK